MFNHRRKKNFFREIMFRRVREVMIMEELIKTLFLCLNHEDENLIFFFRYAQQQKNYDPI